LSASDPLDGFRGQPPELELAAGERLLRHRMQESAGLIKLVQHSEAMREWLESPTGRALQDEVEDRLSKALAVWLAATDPCSDACKAAHYEARVAAGIIQTISAIIDKGPEAARSVAEADQQANAELSDV
jgi:hypothetical protein